MKVLSFGEVLWDVYPDKKFIGGAPLNFAAHLARHGEDVAMLTAVGQDELGAQAQEIVKGFGISADFIEKHPEYETGKCLVTLDENQVPSYNLLKDVAYDFINGEKIKRDEFDILYFGTLALRGENNRRVVEDLIGSNSFAEIFVDVNIRPPFYSDETIIFALKNATILKISDEELPVILKALEYEITEDSEKCAREISKQFKNLKLIIITKGGKGAFVFDCNSGSGFGCPAGKEKPLSTVGAGDSFSAAFLHKYLKGEELINCLLYATKIADFVVSRYEAVPDYCVENF